MRLRRIVAFTIIASLFQVTVLNYFSFLHVKPDLILAAVFIASFSLSLRQALLLALLGGIFKDAFSLSRFGLNAGFFPLWVFVVKELSRRVSIEDGVSRTLLLIIIAFSHNILTGLILVNSGAQPPLGIFLRITLLSSFYTAACYFLVSKYIIRWRE
jgi:rod shape-determining protein MreD